MLTSSTVSRAEAGYAPRPCVVVTGIGAVTPLGLTAEASWQSLLAGRSGIGPITRFDASILPVRIAGEIKDFQPDVFMERKEVRRARCAAHLVVAAVGGECFPASSISSSSLASGLG